MAMLSLQPCRIRDTKIVPDRTAAIQLFAESDVLARFFSSKVAAQAMLPRLEPLSFIGLTRTSRGVVPFVLRTPDLTGNIKFLLRKDPGFAARVVEVFRIELVDLTGPGVTEGVG